MSTSQRVSTPLKPNKKPQISTPKTPSSLSSQTPDKPASEPQRRSRRSMAMSINDVRRSARNIRAKQGAPRVENEGIRSARKQILMPESPVKKPRNVNSDVDDKLPEKYEKLRELFDSMDSSIQLLRLKGRKTSFANIRSQVECLTGSFTDAHLAQMKFILPEAIELKKVLAFNELTYRMEPELHVSLNMEFLKEGEDLKSEILNMPLRKLFRSRLMEFVKSHPEGDEVPEEVLPVPFNRSKQKPQSDIIRPHVSHDMPIDAVTNEQLAVASHLPKTFRRFFSQKLSGKETKKTLQNASESSVIQSVPSGTSFNKAFSFDDTSSTIPSPAKAALEKANDVDFSAPNTSASSLKSLDFPATPNKEVDYIKSKDNSPSEVICNQSTPAKLALTPARLMSMTPSVNTSKRSDISTDDDSNCSMNKLVRRPPRNRPLKFEDDLDDLLPADLLQSIREKEKKAKEEQDPAISQAKKRKQMIASLPKLVNKIRYLFQSLSRSVITKGELMQKLVACQLDISERHEVEEQLDLLLELVPDWLSEKMASSGDILLVINKISNLDSIRLRLEQAK